MEDCSRDVQAATVYRNLEVVVYNGVLLRSDPLLSTLPTGSLLGKYSLSDIMFKTLLLASFAGAGAPYAPADLVGRGYGYNAQCSSATKECSQSKQVRWHLHVSDTDNFC